MNEIINPWSNVTWDAPYAECDKEIIFSPKYKKKLQIDLDGWTLPEPFSGNPNSHVLCLNGNPGRRDENFINKDIVYKNIFYGVMKESLVHSIYDFTWLTEEIKKAGHSGSGWWERITKLLRSELSQNKLENVMPQLFVLEYFPYHSKKMFNFPKLPSDRYRNYLLRKAMNDEKLIVIMRAQTRWESILEDGLGASLKEYPYKIVLNSPQNVCLSKNNMGVHNWNLLIQTLKRKLDF